MHLADALDFDFRELRGDGPPLRLIGNLPYNVSTPLLFHFVAQLDAFADMHFMLQREVVARMAAQPDTGDYGRLTVTLAPHVAVEPLFDIGTGAFKPPPRVVSTFFALHPHASPPFDTGDPAAYASVVAAAFSKRASTRAPVRRRWPPSNSGRSRDSAGPRRRPTPGIDRLPDCRAPAPAYNRAGGPWLVARKSALPLELLPLVIDHRSLMTSARSAPCASTRRSWRAST